ncbi:hypothetical protein GUITHDRAFT_144539 [Guillardia theta CCMP2712]|uniref:Uncharacterized protein n=1 Tax=Guillardia theta (strain CCMP2712) TaxID=905079 RepID=L1IP29_GUITC|nr:hypothetical protein GUITHDRAFT_144539 [Guillardia theta CCMP2712]EKX38046.1 hypothetical protein GUITHDRAFT_144539 [Guillardia theta CCMP2712]|eukprot:XP_005825026.1 hypothetical protein GUITHDRAFT_144539 [Guillardia theta CCMP2712]
MAMMPGRLLLHSLVCCLFLANLGTTLGFTPMARLPNLICSEANNKIRNIQIPAFFFPKHKKNSIVASDIDEVKPVVEKLQQVIKVDVKPYQEDKSSNQKTESTVDRAKRKPLMDKIQSPLVPDPNGQCMPGFHSKVTEGSAAEPARKEDAEERRAASAAVMKADKGSGVTEQSKSKALMERDRILKASRAAEEQARRKYEEVQRKAAQKKIEKEREFQQMEDAELRQRMKAEQVKEAEERERALQKAQEEEIKRAIEVGIDPTTDTMPLKPKKKD